MGKGKKVGRILVIFIFIIAGFVFISGVDSEDIDEEFCNTTGYILKRGVNNWTCAFDNNSLGGLSCSDSQIPVWNTTVTSWTCGEKGNGSGGSGDITAVTTAGVYLYGGAMSGQADLLINSSYLNGTIGNITDARDDDTDTDTYNTTQQIITAANSTDFLRNWSLYIIDTDTDTYNTTQEIVTAANNTGLLRNWTYDITGGDIADERKIGHIVGMTTGSYDGNLSNSTHIGYVRANALCNEEYTGSHFCTEVEVVLTIANGSYGYSGTAWMAKGAPGYTAPANDCNGWNSDDGTDLTVFWNWDLNSGPGAGELTICSQSKKLMCCRP